MSTPWPAQRAPFKLTGRGPATASRQIKRRRNKHKVSVHLIPPGANTLEDVLQHVVDSLCTTGRFGQRRVSSIRTQLHHDWERRCFAKFVTLAKRVYSSCSNNTAVFRAAVPELVSSAKREFAPLPQAQRLSKISLHSIANQCGVAVDATKACLTVHAVGSPQYEQAVALGYSTEPFTVRKVLYWSNGGFVVDVVFDETPWVIKFGKRDSFDRERWAMGNLPTGICPYFKPVMVRLADNITQECVFGVALEKFSDGGLDVCAEKLSEKGSDFVFGIWVHLMKEIRAAFQQPPPQQVLPHSAVPSAPAQEQELPPFLMDEDALIAAATAASLRDLELSQSRQLRSQQDQEYQEALDRDLRQQEDATLHQQRLHQLHEERAHNAQLLQSEPAEGDKDTLSIRARLPDGVYVTRRFPCSAPMSQLFAWIGSQPLTLPSRDHSHDEEELSPHEYRIVHNFTRKLFLPSRVQDHQVLLTAFGASHGRMQVYGVAGGVRVDVVPMCT